MKLSPPTSAKLTEEDVRLIRELTLARRRMLEQASNLTYERLAEKFGVSKRSIRRVIDGETWGHVL